MQIGKKMYNLHRPAVYVFLYTGNANYGILNYQEMRGKPAVPWGWFSGGVYIMRCMQWGILSALGYALCNLLFPVGHASL